MPKQRGDFLRTVLGLRPGSAVFGGDPPLGVPGRAGTEKAQYSLLARSRAQRWRPRPGCRAHPGLGLELWGTWLGGRAGEDSC